MDILAIRKKAREQQSSAATAAPEATSSPAASSPAASSPVVSSPAVSSPAVSSPVVSSPVVSSPAASSPVVSSPAASSPAVSSPAVSSPVVSSPVVSSPVVSSPVVSSLAPHSVVDPLQGFLAADDDVNDVHDDRDGDARSAVDAAHRYLAFRIGVEEYAASIMDIREILTLRSITEVPRAPRDVLGVVSRRGVVLPVVDLGTSLGLRDADRQIRTQQRILVAGDGDRICGLRVDAVSEVIRLPSSSIEAVPASLGQKSAGLLQGLGRTGGRMFILLDIPAVLDALAAAVGLAPAVRTERLP